MMIVYLIYGGSWCFLVSVWCFVGVLGQLIYVLVLSSGYFLFLMFALAFNCNYILFNYTFILNVFVY